MKTVYRYNWLSAAGLVFMLPAVYFILAGVLSEFGINGPVEAVQPYAEQWGIKEPPGLNITSLILFGPVIAFMLAIFQIVKIEWRFNKELFFISFSFQKRWFPLIVATGSAGVLAALFFYMIGENCNC